MSKIKKNKLFGSSRNAKEQAEMDKKLVYALSKSRIPSLAQLKHIGRFLTKAERWTLRSCFAVITASLVFIGVNFYVTNLEAAPIAGGKYVEGLIGSPKQINPLYSYANDVDHDIVALVYSSLFKRGEGGELKKDLVKDYQVTEDGKIYTLAITDKAKFHDGQSLVADDVIFTFGAIKDRNYNSPLRNSFTGVEIEKIDTYSLAFILNEPYAAFLDLLTFGILPANLWYRIPPESAGLAELNLKPIGSGPFKFSQFVKDKDTGKIVEYNLERNNDYYHKSPYIDISFKFYPVFEEAISALNQNLIDGISYLPFEYRNQVMSQKSMQLHKLNFPQMVMIFLNKKNNPALADKSVRRALGHALDREAIIKEVYQGDAFLIDSPILPRSFAYNEAIEKYHYNKAEAEKLLTEAGWKISEVTEEMLAKAKKDEKSEEEDIRLSAQEIINLGPGKWRKKDDQYLVIGLKTINNEIYTQASLKIKEYWEEVGIKTYLELVQPELMRPQVITGRNFQALLSSQIASPDPDPYAFWHSSQAEEGGLNVADYVNKEADQLMEDARITINMDERKEKYFKFQEIIAEEAPVLFLYSPAYTYTQTGKIKAFKTENIYFPRDRFADIHNWYINTGKKLVW